MEYQVSNTVILLIVTYLVTNGIKSISTLIGQDLSGYGSAVAASLVAVCIALFQSVAIPAIPAEYLPMVEQVAGVIVALLGAMGVHKTVKSFTKEK